MKEVNIWELRKVHIKLKESFLRKINLKIRKEFKSKEKFYNLLEMASTPFATFRNLFKYSYYGNGFFSDLNVFLKVCKKLGINYSELQRNILAYKTSKGQNIIEQPILPIKINPIFDMVLAHNIADGTVIDPKRKRQAYFGYRQFDKKLRLGYVKKLESVFGKIKFKGDYFNESTRPYCPAVLSQLFFKHYDLNKRSFLSKTARLPEEIFNKDKDYLLSVLLAFVVDEGNIDSTMIVIKLKNRKLTKDLCKVCKILRYKFSFSSKGEYGTLYILREGMKDLFSDYKYLLKKYPVVKMHKVEEKIDNSLKIYERSIYKKKGNREVIMKMIESENLTVNQVVRRINMTRQGVRNHIHKLEKENKIFRKGLIGRNNILYAAGGER